MYKILVAANHNKDGRWSARRTVWATFRIYSDATHYYDNLKRNNPEWVIVLAHPRRRVS